MANFGKNLLGTLSPVYGMATGHGLFGKDVGILPALAGRYRDEREEKKRRARQQAGVPEVGMPEVGMRKGGKAKTKSSSASKRADGIAKKGKTRGKFV